ncbi:MAG: conjugal transfer protein TraG, partial [Chloroflexi bacterium]|nr:conjugal transfer protein TraG [Chloroflexota bacterium]
MKQQMIINAFDDSVIGWTQETGNAAAMQGYMKARSDMQTSAVYRTTGIQAEKWVPILRIVFEALYYGAFPLALLMMLTPLGFTVVRGYFSGFVWLQSWGPLYAVLHRIMMGEVALKSTSLSGSEGVTMISQVGINAIVQDASAMAGYLSMSVPFIAIGVMFGANRFASLATSMLAPTQRASGTAAEEGTSGNINIGNTGQDNHNFSNTAGFSMRTNALIDHGMVSSRNEDGSMYHRGAAGNESVFKDLAISDPGFNAAFGSRVSQSLQERSAESSSHAVTQAESASKSIGASMGESLAFSNTLQNSEGFNSSQGKEQREAVVDSASNIRQAAQRLSEGTNWSEQQSLRALASASLETEFLNLKGGGEWSMAGTSRENWDKAKTVSEEFGVRESFEKLHSTSQNMQFSEGQSNLRDLRDSMNASYNEGQSAEKSLGESLTRVQSYDKTLNTLKEDNGSFTANLNQTALEIGAEQFGGNVNEAYLAAKGNPLLAENWADDAVQNYINNLPVEDKTPGSLMGDIHGSRGADAGLLNEMNRDGVAAGGTPDNNIDEKREEMNEAAKRRSQLMQNNSQEINDRYSHANRTTGETVEDRSDDGVIDGLGQNISDGYEAVKGLFDSDDKKPEENK